MSVAANYEAARGTYSLREFVAKTAIVLKDARAVSPVCHE